MSARSLPGYDADDAKHALSALGIYPHGIHVIVEGDTEEALVRGLVEMLLGSAFLEEVVITNLRGVGGATRIEKLLSAVADYALRTVLIVDDEGDMREPDVLVHEKSFEESNFSDEELVELAVKLASTSSGNRPAPTLTLTAAELREYHDDRVERSNTGDKPGLANSLEKLARPAEHGSVNFSNGELADVIVDQVSAELRGASTWKELDKVAERRPVLDHIAQRIITPLRHEPTDRPPRRR
jgi:hypothetical protein